MRYHGSMLHSIHRLSTYNFCKFPWFPTTIALFVEVTILLPPRAPPTDEELGLINDIPRLKWDNSTRIYSIETDDGKVLVSSITNTDNPEKSSNKYVTHVSDLSTDQQNHLKCVLDSI